MNIFDKAFETSQVLDFLQGKQQLEQLLNRLSISMQPNQWLDYIKSIQQGNKLYDELQAILKKKVGYSLQHEENTAVALTTPRRDTSHLYVSDEKTTKTKRQNQNDQAFAIVQAHLNGQLSLSDISDEQRQILGRYTGNGGGLKDNLTGQIGSAHEYYTPIAIAQGIWQGLANMGFGGGLMLDPCSGSGVFGATAPLNTAVDCVELDKTSGTVNKLINQSDSYNVTISNFEKVAKQTPDEIYDSVVSNVPFGDNREGHQFDDDVYQDQPLENYFILRSLDKLKAGGLACFIVPTRCTDGLSKKEKQLRYMASLKAEFLGAVRLPNKVFSVTGADVITDVIFFKKHSKNAQKKIDDLLQSNASVLSESNVLWAEYLDGQYFKHSGRKYVLGDFVAKDENKFRDVDRVMTDKSTLEIAQALGNIKFKGRIDWALLDTTEAEHIVYHDGDMLVQNGRTLQLQNGQWQIVQGEQPSEDMQALYQLFKDPIYAFNQQATFEQAQTFYQYLHNKRLFSQVPVWLEQIYLATQRNQDYFTPCLMATAVKFALENKQATDDYTQIYPVLSQGLKDYAGRLSKIKIHHDEVKRTLKLAQLHYKDKQFSDVWQGKIQQLQAEAVNVDYGFDGLIYKNQSHWVKLEQAKALFGDDFDPMNDKEWAISADGLSVCRADDYYVGNIGHLIDDIEKQIKQANHEPLKIKLLSQLQVAKDRMIKIDTQNMDFNLLSPYVSLEDKVRFLKDYVHSSAFINTDKDGQPFIDFEFNSVDSKQDENKIIKRITQYLKSGNLSLGGIDTYLGDEQALNVLRNKVRTLNTQFSGWVRSQTSLTERLEYLANNPYKQYFNVVDDSRELHIVGMNPELKLHDYQRAFVRQMGRNFQGINGYDVGLGKTFTALASVQYVQSIGVKKKTVFIVPNAVLSNWYKEAGRAYLSLDDCLFVGLREKNGKLSTDSKYYDEDLLRIQSNQHRKIFMTMEAFERIRLKDDTIEQFEQHLAQIDTAFAQSEQRKKDSRAKNRSKSVAELLKSKTGVAPYLEELGVDSLVMDEAHAYKNSSDSYDFKGGKYLSLSPSSNRGLDCQAKAWYIRGMQKKGDGVLLLTATPITNSPLEIYSMLSLAVGHGRVNDLMLSATGADDFLNAVCEMRNEPELTIDGRVTDMRVFTGLNNTQMLRRLINHVATIKTSDDVGQSIFVPSSPVDESQVVLDKETLQRLDWYKTIYRIAKQSQRKSLVTAQELDMLQNAIEMTGDSEELLAHPFNLISKMSNAILDKDLDDGVSRYTIDSKQQDKVKKLLAKWNAKPPTEERNKLGRLTERQHVVSEKVSKDGEPMYKVNAVVRQEDGVLILDSNQWKTQDAFETMAEAMGVNLGVSINNKLAGLLEKFKKEQSVPRGLVKNEHGETVVLPYAKQIIFCDSLPLHNKIRNALVQYAGVDKSKIAIITGQRNHDPMDILEIQNGFNSVDDNRYQVIIANEKAEVGINLQIGTQAIHHLTIGWTADSLQQRNGRGVRQGNLTQDVSIYYYDANGTFDSMKRRVVNAKANWIGELLDSQHTGKVNMNESLSREELDLLIDATGDSEKMLAVQQKILDVQHEQRVQEIQRKQLVHIKTLKTELANRKSHQSPETLLADIVVEIFKLGDSNPDKKQQLMNYLQQAFLWKNETALESLINDATRFYGRGKMPPSQVHDKVIWNYNKHIQVDENKQPMVNEQSEFYQDWQEKQQSIDRLITMARRDFNELAQQDGAYSASIIENMNKAHDVHLLSDDYIIVTNGLVVFEDKGETVIGCYIDYGRGNFEYWDNKLGIRNANYLLPDMIKNKQLMVLNPDHVDYDKYALQIAQWEDRQQVDYFSKHNPHIARLRQAKTDKIHRLDVEDTLVKDGDFLLPLLDKKYIGKQHLVPFFAKLAERQSIYIDAYFGSFFKTKESHLQNFIKKESLSGTFDLLWEIEKFSKAFDVKMTEREFTMLFKQYAKGYELLDSFGVTLAYKVATELDKQDGANVEFINSPAFVDLVKDLTQDYLPYLDLFEQVVINPMRVRLSKHIT